MGMNKYNNFYTLSKMETSSVNFDLLGLNHTKPELNEFWVKLITDLFVTENSHSQCSYYENNANNDLNSL